MTRRQRVTFVLGCALVGALGAVLGLVTWHLWQDHQLLHKMQDFVNQQPPPRSERLQR
jgi:hypothetical protein